MKNEFLVNEPANIYIRSISEEDETNIRNIAVEYTKNKKKATTDFKKLFGVDITHVIAFGETERVNSKILNKIIPDTSVDRQIHKSYESPRIELSNSTVANKKYGKQYKCYAIPTPSIIMHEDIRSSWNCLMSVLNRPDRVLIYSKS